MALCLGTSAGAATHIAARYDDLSPPTAAHRGPPKGSFMARQMDTTRAELAHGWRPLLAATIGCGTGASSLMFYSLGVFVAPLEAAFGWSRGQITAAMLYSSLGLILAAPVLGWLLDRYGERRVALLSIPGFIAVLYGLSQMQGALAVFYGYFFLAAVLGCGTTPIVYSRAVASRFDSARGLALGITLAGPGTAALLLPTFLSGQIASHDWRYGFLLLAAMALVAVPLVALGLGPIQHNAYSAAAANRGTARLSALKSRVYWTLAAAFIVVAAACSAMVVHLVPMLRDAGLDLPAAARVASVTGVGIILGRLLVGWLIDRMFAPRVAAIVFAVAAGGCLLLIYGGTSRAAIAALLMGFALGAEADLMAYLVSRYFGLRHFGFLYGVIYAGFWVGIAGGPAIAGYLFDAYGNYALALWAIVGLLATGCLLALSLPRFPGAARA